MAIGPKIPLGDGVEWLVDWIEANLGFVLDAITDILGFLLDMVQGALTGLPDWAMIIVIALVAFVISRKFILSVLSIFALLLLSNMGLWSLAMETLSLVLVAALVCLIVGIPVGITCSRSETFNRVVTVILDFMQTMPAFVYLIPAVIFFGLGNVPGLVATVIFAMPPAIRLTNLGIRQVPDELNEVADSFGSTYWQKLTKVQIPVAMPTIMAGINQVIMLSLSMAVIAAMIGARGLGYLVLVGIQRVDIALGFEAGLGIVIIAIILDRITQSTQTE
ncbi:MAG: ABC transporter permease [Methanomassiliicoccales archaeon]